jgi:hypothetical protein
MLDLPVPVRLRGELVASVMRSSKNVESPFYEESLGCAQSRFIATVPQRS